MSRLIFVSKCSTTNKNDTTYKNDILPFEDPQQTLNMCITHIYALRKREGRFMEQNKLLEVSSSAGCNYFEIQFSNNSLTDALSFS